MAYFCLYPLSTPSLLLASLLSGSLIGLTPAANATGVTVITPVANTPWISFWGRWCDPSICGGVTSTEGAGAYFIVQFNGATTLNMDISNSPSKGFWFKTIPAIPGITGQPAYTSPVNPIVNPNYPYNTISSESSSGIWTLNLPSTGTYTVVVYAVIPNNTWTPYSSGSGAYIWTLNSLSINAGTFQNVTGFNNPKYSIEYIGASITAGGNGDGYYHSFTALSAQYLVAHTTSSVQYSNFGIYGRGVTFPNYCPGPAAVCTDMQKVSGVAYEADWSGVYSSDWEGTKLPNVIVVDLGANDNFNNISDAGYQNALVSYMRQILTVYPGVHIYVVAPFQCAGGSTSGCQPKLPIYPNYSNDVKSAIDLVIHTGSPSSSHIHFVDTSPPVNNIPVPWLQPCTYNSTTGIWSSPDYGSDCVHPNDSSGAPNAGNYLGYRMGIDFTGTGTINDDKGFCSATYGCS